MKNNLVLILLFLCQISVFSQSDSILKFIFVPHPRTENKVKQTVLPGIEKIDFSKFDVTLIGGDVTYSTSKDRTSLDYCDSIFNLHSPNTLWGLGNHDVQSGNLSLLKEYTGRERFYSYTRNNITFMVLDCEQDVHSSSTFISGNQLQMVKNICDTISKSSYLMVLHSRLMWMINNEFFKPKMDSIAATSKCLDTTNFYSEVYPLLQKATTKGIQVVCMGGDKSLINVQYSPEKNMTFYTAKMTPTYPDSINNVVIFNYNQYKKTMTSHFVPLSKMDEYLKTGLWLQTKKALSLFLNPTGDSFEVTGFNGLAKLTLFNINGRIVGTKHITDKEQVSIDSLPQGIYIARIETSNGTYCLKISKLPRLLL